MIFRLRFSLSSFILYMQYLFILHLTIALLILTAANANTLYCAACKALRNDYIKN